MPSGAGPGGGFLFSTVGRNRFDVAASAAGSAGRADGLGRVAVKATIAAAAIVTTATHVHALLLRRGTDTVLIGFERRLLICRLCRITSSVPASSPLVELRPRTDSSAIHGPPDRAHEIAWVRPFDSAILQVNLSSLGGATVWAQAVPVCVGAAAAVLWRLSAGFIASIGRVRTARWRRRRCECSRQTPGIRLRPGRDAAGREQVKALRPGQHPISVGNRRTPENRKASRWSSRRPSRCRASGSNHLKRPQPPGKWCTR